MKLSIILPNPKTDWEESFLISAFSKAGFQLSRAQILYTSSHPEELTSNLAHFQPNCILLFGSKALALTGVTHSLSLFRGSVYNCSDSTSPFFNYKCIATHDPKDLASQYELKPIIEHDIRRAVTQAGFPELVLPQRVKHVQLTSQEIISRLNAISPGDVISVDIEGGIPKPEAKTEYRNLRGIVCVGIATSPLDSFIVNHLDHPPEQRVEILKALARVLADADIGKILQNSLYDNFCLSWHYQMPIYNVIWDTMLSGWELAPEFAKSLAFQASLYTLEPYYKADGRSADTLTHYRYCCTDACVTYEIYLRHKELLTNAQLEHYNLNLRLLPAILYMELKGIRYDSEQVAAQLAFVQSAMAELQSSIDTAVGVPVNINSPKQLQQALYENLQLPKHYSKIDGRSTESLTTDAEALLDLYQKTKNETVLSILRWRQYESQRKQLQITADKDNRVRCSYNLVGTKTGRLSCSESPTGSGANLTTIMSQIRRVYTADEGYNFFQCDLSGADGWTVAAWAKYLGDDTMWLDYLYGLKPALIIAGLYLDPSISKLPREQLALRLAELKPSMPSWLYATCKAVQHGSNYAMRPKTMAINILRQSWKKAQQPTHVSPAVAESLQNLYLKTRYPGVSLWQAHVQKQLLAKGYLVCASGHRRTFYSRLKDQGTFRDALSQEPQNVTTWVTNLALEKLWSDPENRDANGRLIIQPMHSIHDAIAGQFPKDQTAWAISKITSYFANPIEIAGQRLTIPFEGCWGPSWGELPKENTF